MSVGEHMEKGNTLSIIYQSETATDKIPHQIKKLTYPCDRIKIILLIISRLKDTKQKVGFGGHFSGWRCPW